MKYDAILILGGGVRACGELPEYAKRRFDLALAKQSGEPMVPLSAWTTHRPAIFDAGRMLTESHAGAGYLLAHGISAGRIFCETTSYDTIGNAYFSRVQLTDPLGWRRLLIITSKFHMPRTEAIFEWIYGLDSTAPYRLEFAAAPDDGLSETALQVRSERERESLRSVQQLRERLTSMRETAQWLFTEHNAYRSVRQPVGHQSSALLDSY